MSTTKIVKSAAVPTPKKSDVKKADAFAQFATFGELQAEKQSKAATKGAPVAKKTAKEQAQVIAADVAKGAHVTVPKVKPDTKPLVAPAIKSLCLVNYAPNEYSRPKAGALLYAFTAAWQEMFNMIHGASVAYGTLKAVCGPRAISHHTDAGRLTVTAKNHVELTAQGLNYFSARKAGLISGQHYSEKVKDAYIAMMTTGIIDNALIKTPMIKLCA